MLVTAGHDDCWRSQFRRNQYADSPGFQARAERQSCVFQTSPAVAHEVALTTAYEKREAIFSRVSKALKSLKSFKSVEVICGYTNEPLRRIGRTAMGRARELDGERSSGSGVYSASVHTLTPLFARTFDRKGA